MSIDIVLIIIFTSIIQSIFGTGVLLFGTPLLLLFGYNFQSLLFILLPTSVLINLFQLKNNLSEIDFSFYKKLILFCIPSIVISLYYINFKSININTYIGILLILIALKNTIPSLKRAVELLIKKDFIYLIITGFIHGISNLGGALLSAIVINKNLSKNSTRSTIALSYLTFAIFQIVTIIFIIGNNSFVSLINASYWMLGIIVFLIVENTFYLKINEKIYIKFFTGFLISTGILLLIKSLF